MGPSIAFHDILHLRPIKCYHSSHMLMTLKTKAVCHSVYIVMHSYHSFSSSLANTTLDTLQNAVLTYLPLYLLVCFNGKSARWNTTDYVTFSQKLGAAHNGEFCTWFDKLEFLYFYFFPLYKNYTLLFALPCLPVCRPEAVGRGIETRAKVK